MDTRAGQKDLVAKMLQKMEQTSNGIKQMPLRKRQEVEARDPGAPGNLWVSKVRWSVETSPKLKQAVIDTWDRLNFDDAKYFDFDCAQRMEAEWVGGRQGSKPKDASPELPPGESYSNLMKEVKSPLTIFYIHGGSFV